MQDSFSAAGKENLTKSQRRLLEMKESAVAVLDRLDQSLERAWPGYKDIYPNQDMSLIEASVHIERDELKRQKEAVEQAYDPSDYKGTSMMLPTVASDALYAIRQAIAMLSQIALKPQEEIVEGLPELRNLPGSEDTLPRQLQAKKKSSDPHAIKRLIHDVRNIKGIKFHESGPVDYYKYSIALRYDRVHGQYNVLEEVLREWGKDFTVRYEVRPHFKNCHYEKTLRALHKALEHMGTAHNYLARISKPNPGYVACYNEQIDMALDAIKEVLELDQVTPDRIHRHKDSKSEFVFVSKWRDTMEKLSESLEGVFSDRLQEKQKNQRMVSESREAFMHASLFKKDQAVVRLEAIAADLHRQIKKLEDHRFRRSKSDEILLLRVNDDAIIHDIAGKFRNYDGISIRDRQGNKVFSGKGTALLLECN